MLPSDKILILQRAEDKSTSTIGDGLLEISEDHPDYKQYKAYMEGDVYKFMTSLEERLEENKPGDAGKPKKKPGRRKRGG